MPWITWTWNYVTGWGSRERAVTDFEVICGWSLMLVPSFTTTQLHMLLPVCQRSSSPWHVQVRQLRAHTMNALGGVDRNNTCHSSSSPVNGSSSACPARRDARSLNFNWILQTNCELWKNSSLTSLIIILYVALQLDEFKLTCRKQVQSLAVQSFLCYVLCLLFEM